MIGERGSRSPAASASDSRSRALAVDPRILVLDDATASVDATTEALIRIGLRGAMAGRTTFIIAHRLSTIALADEVVVLDQGRIAARGTHEELITTSPIYREIYEHGLSSASSPMRSRRARRSRKSHEGLPGGQPPHRSAVGRSATGPGG